MPIDADADEMQANYRPSRNEDDQPKIKHGKCPVIVKRCLGKPLSNTNAFMRLQINRGANCELAGDEADDKDSPRDAV